MQAALNLETKIFSGISSPEVDEKNRTATLVLTLLLDSLEITFGDFSAPLIKVMSPHMAHYELISAQ